MKKIAILILSVALSANALAETKVVMQTSEGEIELLLDEKKAPKTVANFVNYANKGFYSNTIFHRVIDGFMIQGGGFNSAMLQKTTDKPIANEANNGLKNTIGTIAMARTNDPHSATSQFFINVNNNDFLNHTAKTVDGYGYTVFGKVSKGMDVVNKIAQVRTTTRMMHQNVPVAPIVIQSVKVVK
ncbi:peptidylprolyl isomerase [Alysiella filiformis]|uniref:Peptidyl-prolyl cis-trans isomerase n=1 Tax=Alysiella filiformis DSM 16848 TaxID=1120981 RepID=A0A286EAK3_9NEIS|nr:peptidylprolyl isomerase [Alysiella filiformis]QMT32274.1 peptidyl-prolyl cis-trans isomerase [Alysiella filiformis]UBQ56805.1 peptidyl-prolyl cis-trans isomerase [Alysiella filiformis DSM 16848]SOD67975.1 peptidyl-prolyl cis-trans isomerase B (cyclophilin B) [Alysiella filiformis DSM 16848]